jgi:hypothetical protein
MMILEKHQLSFAVAILSAVIIGAVLLNAYIGTVTDKAKADQFHADVQQQISDFKRELQPKLDAIAQDAKIKDPVQIALKVPDYQQGVRPTIVIPGGVPTQQAATQGNIPVTQVTHPEDVPVGSLVIKPEQIPNYWKSVTQCATDQTNLGICTKELALTKDDLSHYKNLSNGGNFLQRIKRNSKWFFIGAGTGAAIGYAAKH